MLSRHDDYAAAGAAYHNGPVFGAADREPGRAVSPPEQTLKVLIAEDDSAQRMMLAILTRQLGYLVVEAEDGCSAVKVFAAQQPDIVLMDMLMPGMDGDRAMHEMRALSGERWVPILFVTVVGAVDVHVGALANGADDYLIKPVHEDVLWAKLEVARRMIGLRRQIEDKNRQLKKYHDAAEDEMRVVKHLITRMVRSDKVPDEKLEHCIFPAENFSGDAVMAARTPAGVLHVMLADGAGHGLAAALNVLPIAPCFYSMTEKGIDIEEIVATINATIREQMPIDRFVASTLIAVDFAARRVKVWNGGNPPLLALNVAGEVLHRLESHHLALGIVAPALFAPGCEVFDYAEPCQLFGYSDGVVESYELAGEPDGQAKVESLLLGVPAKVRMKLLRNRLAARLAERRAHDDMTLLLVDCADDNPLTVKSRGKTGAACA